MKLLSLGLIATAFAAILVDGAAIPQRRNVLDVSKTTVTLKDVASKIGNGLCVNKIANNAKVNALKRRKAATINDLNVDTKNAAEDIANAPHASDVANNPAAKVLSRRDTVAAKENNVGVNGVGSNILNDANLL
ncbi:hypothetical protein G6F58_012117 [Rhizopus delemar]|nr:hypothetical protein G6F58_012117 [Rhizopus delemar]